MTPKQRKALEESLAHWKRMRALPAQKVGFGSEQPRGMDCACCQTFRACIGCPIKEHTGVPSCRHTPYMDAYDAWISVEYERLVKEPTRNAVRRWRYHADREIKFLEGLLDE